jgi:hypothetical protein
MTGDATVNGPIWMGDSVCMGRGGLQLGSLSRNPDRFPSPLMLSRG